MAKDKARIAAAVDIGSSAIRMKIAQLRGEAVDVLDELESPLGLGRESFTHGTIGFDTLAQGIRILRQYYKLQKEYAIPPEYTQTAATTALREADNRIYIVDQLRLQTGRGVAVLEDGQEKSLIFRESLRRLAALGPGPGDPFLMAYIGTGSVGLALVEGGIITYARNVKAGSLRLTETLSELARQSRPSPGLLEEYIAVQTQSIRTQLAGLAIRGFVATGKEVDLIARLCGQEPEGPVLRISREKVRQTYDAASPLLPAQIMAAYGLNEEQADTLLPSLALYMSLMDFTAADEMICPRVQLTDALLYDLLFPGQARQSQRDFEAGIVASARRMAAGYAVEEGHARAVEAFALEMFDKIRRVHGFSRRERLYLRLAAILHNVGKYVDPVQHAAATAHIITDSNLIDLTRREAQLVAQIARCHGGETPSPAQPEFAALSAGDRLVVAKLAAILKLADALDCSHRQKITHIELRLERDSLTVLARSDQDLALEKWTFSRQAAFFGEVFGLACELRQKGW